MALPGARERGAPVDDEGLVVPDVDGSVVVRFDDRFVWSFTPRRDGRVVDGARRVTWPVVLAERLSGTTRVRVSDAAGEVVHLDEVVRFGGVAEPLRLVDAQGHPLAVDRAHHLTRVFGETSEDVRRQVVAGAARALTDLRDRLGVDAHLSYGCLLGAVRDGRMIGHDSDADLAYYSPHAHPADVVRESFALERGLRRLGWKVVRMSGGDLKLFLPLDDGRAVQIDVFGAFHADGVFYQLGGRSGTLPAEALTPASTVVLEGVELAAPADPERVLAFLYGEGWRVPDPAFVPVDPAAGVRRLDGWLRGPREGLPRWNELFRTRGGDVPRRGSSFARWAVDRVPADATVVDVGSGTGRDAAFWRRRGHRVVALDYSGAALARTRRRLQRAGETDPDVRVLALDDARTALVAGAELAREETPPWLCARGLLGCLDLEARTHLWRVCLMALRRGGALLLEHPATRDDLPAEELDGMVARVPTDALRRELEAAGARVTHVEHVEGEGLLGEPDPWVARLEVRWDHLHPTRRTGSGTTTSEETP
ncbi:class I SAM-dependent methyltransferase [Nocardioides aurantiacus]|uniref:class I SAM-dependent methyltransferase n=1 Tax=Nocardioides aurantiacus TaxID=86796 RepID=UPI00403F47D4